MSEDEVRKDLIHAVAQAIILFGPIADCRLQFTASDIANILNPAKESRRHINVVNEADLEAGFSESIIRNSLGNIFPMQLEFNRHTRGKGAHFYKIKFFNSLSVGHLSIGSIAAAITVNIEEAEDSRKRKRKIKAPAAASAASPAPALPSTISPASAPAPPFPPQAHMNPIISIQLGYLADSQL
jgi:hypothetical protein